MKVASVVWNKDISANKVPDYIHYVLNRANKSGHKIIVFPGLLVAAYSNGDQSILNKITKLSKEFSNLLICPGSYFEQEKEKTYHSSCFILNGEIVFKQRQLYLAKWERTLGLSRGTELNVFPYHSITLALIISTDVFYTQVTRYAALNGVHLALTPVALITTEQFTAQLSRVWQNVQQHTIFGVESGFKGTYGL